MSCRLDTLADMQCRRVGDMNEDMSPTRHAMSANEGLGRHDRLRHSLLSINNTRGCGEVPPLLFGAFPALSLSVL
jgi:hypothetical protein